MPLVIESWPRPGPTTRCSIDGELGRQRAGAQQDRQIVRLLDREVAGDLPVAAEDRRLDDGRRDHVPVEDDGERTADVLLGHLAELAGSRPIEGEIHRRPAVLIEGAAGIGEVRALHQHLLVDQDRRSSLALRRFQCGGILLVPGLAQDLRIRRHPALLRLLHRHRDVDQPELELGGLADEIDAAAADRRGRAPARARGRCPGAGWWAPPGRDR